MVECSAILISKILKASNRHFSFDGWHRPVPPIPVSQQWPAPADPLRGEKMGSGNIRCPVVRFEPLLPLRPTRRCNSMTWYHGNPTLKRYKGEQVTSESNLMSLRCHFIAVLPLCSYYYFSTPLHCPAYIFVFFSRLSSISISVRLPACLDCDAGLTLSWLGKIDRCSDGRKRRDIKMKARPRDPGMKVEGHLTSCMTAFYGWWWWPSFSTVGQ